MAESEIDWASLVELRRELHRRPELAGREKRTAATVAETLRRRSPSEVLTGVGGTGVIAFFDGPEPGPTVMVRCELDALPIAEGSGLPHHSRRSGVAHKCGHDGHMAIVLGLAARLERHPPARGRVALVFQPAEETGEGGERMLRDPRFAKVAPDWAFALHNLPGYPFGSVILRQGTFASASEGLIARFRGISSHAGEPDRGRSPALAVAAAINALAALPQMRTAFHRAALITLVGARFGGRAFGTSPGEGEVDATLRTHRDEEMAVIRQASRQQLTAIAEAHELAVELERTEPFPATVNDERAVALVRAAAETLGQHVIWADHPFAWSEDFGHFTRVIPAALFGLGAGEDQPALHHPDYDFPDELIRLGTRLFSQIIEKALTA